MRTFGKHFFRLWRNWGTMDCIYGTCFREWTIDMSNMCVFVYFRDLRLGKYVCMRSTGLCMRVHVLCCCSCKEHFGHAQKKNIDRNSFHGSDSSEHENISCDFQILRAQGPGPQDSRIREFEISPDPGSGLASAEPRVRKTYVYAWTFYVALRLTKEGWANFPEPGFRKQTRSQKKHKILIVFVSQGSLRGVYVYCLSLISAWARKNDWWILTTRLQMWNVRKHPKIVVFRTFQQL